MSWPRLTSTQKTNLKTHNVVQSIVPKVANIAEDGVAADLTGYNGGRIVFSVGMIGGTATPTFPLLIKHADTFGGSYTAVAAADLVGGLITDITAANDERVFEVRYIGAKNFIKAAIGTVTGSSPTLPISATIHAAAFVDDLKPFELEQIQDELNRRPVDHGSGSPPSNQPKIGSLI